MSRRAVVIRLGLAQTLAWGSTYYLPAVLAVPMAQSLSISVDVIYAAFSTALIVTALLGPAIGRVIDRDGGRWMLIRSSWVLAAGLAMLGAAQGAIGLFLAWLLIGVGMAMGLYESAFATLAGLYGRDARGPITGITLLAGFASTVCWPISAGLEASFDWRSTCFVWAGAQLALGWPLYRKLPGRQLPLPVPATQDEPSPAMASRSVMTLLALIFAGTWFISTAMAAHLPRLLESAGAAPAAAIAAAALVGPAQVAGRLLEFRLLRHLHPLWSARSAALAHPVGALALLGFGAPAAALFAVLHGVGNGVLTIAKGTLPLALFGPVGYGHRQGLLMVPARFAQAAAPLIFSLLMARYDARALLLSVALSLAGLAALLLLSSKPRNHGP